MKKRGRFCGIGLLCPPRNSITGQSTVVQIYQVIEVIVHDSGEQEHEVERERGEILKIKRRPSKIREMSEKRHLPSSFFKEKIV